jgi:hypothetical protein
VCKECLSIFTFALSAKFIVSCNQNTHCSKNFWNISIISLSTIKTISYNYWLLMMTVYEYINIKYALTIRYNPSITNHCINICLIQDVLLSICSVLFLQDDSCLIYVVYVCLCKVVYSGVQQHIVLCFCCVFLRLVSGLSCAP